MPRKGPAPLSGGAPVRMAMPAMPKPSNVNNDRPDGPPAPRIKPTDTRNYGKQPPMTPKLPTGRGWTG